MVQHLQGDPLQICGSQERGGGIDYHQNRPEPSSPKVVQSTPRLVFEMPSKYVSKMLFVRVDGGAFSMDDGLSSKRIVSQNTASLTAPK